MSAEQNLRIVQDMYAAFGRGDIAFVLDKIADDCEGFSVVSETATGVPWHGAGKAKGKAAAVQYFEALASCVDHEQFEQRDFAASGEEVYARVRLVQLVRATGKALEQPEVVHHFTFDKGKVVRCRVHEDTALTAAAFGEGIVATGRMLFDAFNARDLSRWERALAPGFVADYPCAPGLDRAKARAYNEPFVEAFPDLRFEVKQTVVQGDCVVFAGDVTGTFEKPLRTPDGVLPPTGRSGRSPIVLIAQVRDGKIAREQTVWNQLDVFKQVGIL